MNGIYAPIFLETTTLPETICNDFSARMHRFLATLTDIRYKMTGKTVLYIPEEKRVPENPSEAVKDKELVSRMEATMIHWTRQIKEVLSAQEAVETSENAGPLEEIDFWNNRFDNLNVSFDYYNFQATILCPLSCQKVLSKKVLLSPQNTPLSCQQFGNNLWAVET